MSLVSSTMKSLSLARVIVERSAWRGIRASSSVASSSSASKAKANAWYLDPKLPPPPAATAKRTPVFTTFNPETTLPDAPTELSVADPPPETLPRHLLAFHSYLANETLLVASSVHFYETARAPVPATETVPSEAGGPTLDIRLTRIPQGKRRRRGGDSGNVAMEVGAGVGANWDWVVVAEVAARGKGAVGRAERAIREWVCAFNPFGDYHAHSRSYTTILRSEA
jgi:hypothetical protein